MGRQVRHTLVNHSRLRPRLRHSLLRHQPILLPRAQWRTYHLFHLFQVPRLDHRLRTMLSIWHTKDMKGTGRLRKRSCTLLTHTLLTLQRRLHKAPRP